MINSEILVVNFRGKKSHGGEGGGSFLTKGSENNTGTCCMH